MGKWQEGTIAVVVILCTGIFIWRLNAGIQEAIEYAYPTVTTERLFIQFALALGTAIPTVCIVIWKWDDLKEHLGLHKAVVGAIDATRGTGAKKKAKKPTKSNDSVLKEVKTEVPPSLVKPGSAPRSFYARRP